MASTTLSSATVPATVTFSSNKAQKRMNKVVNMGGLNLYGGLKAQNTAISMGLPVATEQCFANVVSSLRKGKSSNGGALSSTCSAAAEIFRIAAIMNGLTLVGVAVGFVLLRIEASVEESE